MGLKKKRSGLDGAHDRVLQHDQSFSGLNFIDCLDLVDKYLLQSIDGFTHHLNKDAVVAGGVVSLGDLLQTFQAGEGGGIVFGAFKIMPMKQPTS